MKSKALEIRDRITFIAALAVDMNPNLPDETRSYETQRYLLRRCGYACNGQPNIILTRLDGNAKAAFNDPYSYDDRTWRTAHLYIIKHWSELKDGDVVDVEFILGETDKAKISERLETFNGMPS